MQSDTRSSKTLFIALAIALLSTFAPGEIGAAPPDPLPDVAADGSMGTCYAFYETSGEPLPPYAYSAGSRWDRFDFRWNVIEATPGVFSFGAHDAIVNLDAAHGINVVGILGSTAAWATTGCPIRRDLPPALPPGYPDRGRQIADDAWWRACPPDHLNLPWNHPDNAWGNYVYQTVTHFKDRVAVWELWNEPDLGTTYWSGTPEQFAQLLKVGYQAVKAADPDATVLFGGLAYWTDPGYYIQVLDALATLEGAADNNAYFDAMSLHLYSNVYQIGPIAAAIQADMTHRVGPHPIWLTETGVPLWDEHPSNPGVPYLYAATAEEAAAYVIESYAEARAAGIEKFFFFRTHDEAMGEAFGLLRNDLTLRPAYVGYQVAAHYLHGENQITGPFGSTVRRISFYGTPHGRIDVLWNATSEAITTTQPALLPHATLVDVRGVTQTIAAENGSFTIPLAPATANTGEGGALIIGGPPVLLLQGDTEPPTSTLDAPPPVIPPSTLTVTWRVTDTLSGYWYEEIERARTPEGPWTRVAGWGETHGITATAIPLEETGVWYLRARARDRTGNWQPWDTAHVVSTTAVLSRTVALTVFPFSDANGNALWDGDETAPESPAALAWHSAAGGLITATTLITPPWRVTRTVATGDFALAATAADHLNHHAPFTVPLDTGPLTLTLRLPLAPVRGRLFLPTVLRDD